MYDHLSGSIPDIDGYSVLFVGIKQQNRYFTSIARVYYFAKTVPPVFESHTTSIGNMSVVAIGDQYAYPSFNQSAFTGRDYNFFAREQVVSGVIVGFNW
jgi:hypothetical protein